MPVPLEDEFYRRLIDQMEDYAVFTTDLEGRVVSWSEGATRILRYTSGEIKGKHASVIFLPEDVERGLPQLEMQGAREHGKTRDERWHLRRGGERFWADGMMFALKGPDGAFRGYAKVIRDKTESKLSRNMVDEAVQQLRLIIDSVPHLIAYIGPDLRYRFHNRAYEAWFGLTHDTVNGKHMSEVVGREAFELLAPRAKAALKGERQTFEVELPHKQGRNWMRCDYIPHAASDGTVKGFVAFVRDIQDVRAASQDLESRVEERTARLTRFHRELEAFTYSASHDLRNPLRKIDNYAAVLEKETKGLGDEAKRYVGRIRSSAERMHRIIDDMRDLARVTQQELRPEEVDLSALAQKIAAQLQRSAPERKVTWEIEPDLKTRGDEGLVEVALKHLLHNAWKFTEKTDAPVIKFGASCRRCGGGEHLCVSDNGAGFDQAYSDRIFLPFERLHQPDEYPGTGVGLAIVQRVVERHGGRVWAQGAPGQGASFCFTLNEKKLS